MPSRVQIKLRVAGVLGKAGGGVRLPSIDVLNLSRLGGDYSMHG